MEGYEPFEEQLTLEPGEHLMVTIKAVELTPVPVPVPEPVEAPETP